MALDLQIPITLCNFSSEPHSTLLKKGGQGEGTWTLTVHIEDKSWRIKACDPGRLGADRLGRKQDDACLKKTVVKGYMVPKLLCAQYPRLLCSGLKYLPLYLLQGLKMHRFWLPGHPCSPIASHHILQVCKCLGGMRECMGVNSNSDKQVCRPRGCNKC